MRPVGSVNGRIPPGGYPEVSASDGAFLAGFVEGEACFTISKQTRGHGYRCNVQITCRADDGPLLAQLADRTRLGSLGGKPAYATSRRQVSWRISAKADCLRLVELLDRYPLRGRKSHDYALWRTGVDWWLAGDPSARRPQRDWAPMAYLKGRLEEVKRFQAATPALILDPPGLCTDWGGFLAGFLTAEAWFGLAASTRGQVRPRMVVHLRADDRELLNELAARTDVGRVGGPYPNAPSAPSMKWTVCGRDDLDRLIAIIDQHELRGRKGAEFGIWREAVALNRRRPAGFEARLKELSVDLAVCRA